MASSIVVILGNVLVLFHAILTIQSAPCGKLPVLVTPREVVNKVSRSSWMLVKQNPWQQLQESLNRRPRRNLNDMVVSHHCNWTIQIDDNPDRNPRFLSKAVCKDCKWYCRAVKYEHRVLLKDCPDYKTHRANMVLWKWETVKLPVAFVYSP